MNDTSDEILSVVVEREFPHPPEKLWRALTQPHLTPTGTGTLLRMEQAGFRPGQKQAYQGARSGWQEFLTRLEQVLARTD